MFFQTSPAPLLVVESAAVVDGVVQAAIRGEVSLLAELLAFATLLMILGLRVLLPSERRNELRRPLTFLVLHLIVASTRAFIPHGTGMQKLLGPASVFFLLLALGQAAFLLFIDVLVRSAACVRTQLQPRRSLPRGTSP